MRKILFALAALAFMASPVRALVDTYTPNYHWILPYHLSPNWDAKLNTDLIAIDTTVALTIKQGIASLTIGSGTFTSSGANQYSILASSGVKILSGGYAFPDGTVLYSTSGISSSGGSGWGIGVVQHLCGIGSGPSACSGVQKTFTLSLTPTATGSIQVRLDGFTLSSPLDFQISGDQVILTTAPTATTNILDTWYLAFSSVAPVGMLPSTQTWSGSNTYTQGVTFSSGVVLTSATAHSITADTESITNASIQHLIIPSGGTFAYTDDPNPNTACDSQIAITACPTGERVNYGGCACINGFVIISVPTSNTGNSCSAPISVPSTKSATAWACQCSTKPAYAYVFCVK